MPRATALVVLPSRRYESTAWINLSRSEMHSLLSVLVVGLDVGKLMMEVGTLVLRRLGAVRFGILAPAPQSSAIGVLVLLGRVGNRTPASCDGALVNLLEGGVRVRALLLSISAAGCPAGCLVRRNRNLRVGSPVLGENWVKMMVP